MKSGNRKEPLDDFIFVAPKGIMQDRRFVLLSRLWRRAMRIEAELQRLDTRLDAIAASKAKN